MEWIKKSLIELEKIFGEKMNQMNIMLEKF